MIHGGSRRRRQKMAQRLQTGVVRPGINNGGGVTITSTPGDNQEQEELGANLGKNKAVIGGAVALGSLIALSSL